MDACMIFLTSLSISATDLESTEVPNLLPANRTLAVSLNDYLSAVTTARHMLAGLSDCVFLVCQAYDALPRRVAICAISVQSVGFLQHQQPMGSHDLPSDQPQSPARYIQIEV